MPRSVGIQAVGEDEHAGGRGGEGPLQVHPLLPHPDQPADLHEEMDQADQELRAAIQKSWPSTRGGKIDRRSKITGKYGGQSSKLDSHMEIKSANTFLTRSC